MRPLRLTLLALILVASRGSAQEGRRVVLRQFEYRLTSIGETVTASAGVLDASLRPMPSATIKWRSERPAIASVSSNGVVQARAVGSTRVWAIAERDSASAIIIVGGAATRNAIDFTPSPLRFVAVGGRLPLRIRLLDSTGAALADLARRDGACRSLNARVATLAPNGQVISRGAGTTYIRCINRGVRDSVRVEVGQGPVKIAIANGPGGRMTVGDTVQVRARAENGSGELIADASPGWISLDPTVVNIDSVSGLARAVSPGETTIIARLGGISDTLRVAVRAPLGAVSLRLDPVLLFVNDTVRITGTARNAAGAIVAMPEPLVLVRSTRSSVILVIGGSRVVGLGAGTAWVVATSGSLTDSTQITPRDRRALVTQTPTDAAAAEQRARQSLDSARRVELKSSTRRGIGGRLLGVTATASRMAHSSRLAPGVNESRSGLVVGGAASVAPSRTLAFTGDFRTGTLTGDDIGGDVKVTEVDGQLTYWLAEWFGLRGGYTRRSESTDLVLNHWQFANVTAVTRFGVAGGAISTVSALSALPWGGFSGQLDHAGKPAGINKTSYALETGLELQSGWWRAGVTYYGERFTFPAVNGTSRQDRFSSLRLRIGIQP